MANMNVVAYPYAQALFNLAKKERSEEKWLSRLAELAQIMHHPEFQAVLANPKISNDELVSLVNALLKQAADSEITNLLKLLAENNRLGAVSAIYAIFREMLLEDQKRSDAVIESAYELGKADVEELEQLLSKKFGKQITATVKVNPNLIAGIKITVNDKVIDGSVKGRLATLATQLTK